MAHKTKPIRIDTDLVAMADQLAPEYGLKGSQFYNIIFRQGIASVIDNGIQRAQILDEKPKIDTQKLLNAGENTAKKGLESLNLWLNNLTPQQENAVKYSIKGWRKTAADVDDSKELNNLPAIIAQHDALSLQGREAWLPAWEKLSKNVQAELKHTHYKKWWIDSGRSDNFLKMFGDRPTESGWENHLKQQQGYDSDEQEYARQLDKVQEDLKQKGIN